MTNFYNHIYSKENKLIKYINKLLENTKFRNNENIAVIFGLHLIEEAHQIGILENIIIDIEKLNKYDQLLKKIDQQRINTTSKYILNKFNLADSDIDLIATININKLEKFNQRNYNNEDCIVLENIQDPGNLGTILRVATICKVNNVILSKNCVSPYNPKVLRGSQGIQFSLNIVQNVDINDFIKGYSGQILATTPHCNTNIYQINYTQPTAWLFGNEGQGLSKNTLQMVRNISIPIIGHGESLNLAMAVTVCAFEMVRNRNFKF